MPERARLMRACVAVMTAITLSAVSLPAVAHEFWLEPDSFTPETGKPVSFSHYVGQSFKGESYPFLQDWIVRYVVADAAGERPVKGVAGDDPAAKISFHRAGLKILAYHGTPDSLSFDTWEKFEAYLRKEGLEHIAPLHRAEGKPETAIRELYSRCAKTLVQVGGGAGGEDRAVGLPLELVAERNPYMLAAGEALPVRLLHTGKPIAGATIKVFSKADPKNPRRVRTDAEGRATIALPQPGAYLLNAVHMTAPAPTDDAHWTSLWASLTFRRP
ncbi:MAG: DUF4198 domain-containing protein [Methyloligellaceae bacterium]